MSAILMARISDLILRSALLARVSKDGFESMHGVHPSRRGQVAAPQDEVLLVVRK
jgi:hypothetical protein